MHYYNFTEGFPDEDEDGNQILFDKKPSVLYWYEWTKEFGFPNSGGWLDQPYNFMMDINIARSTVNEIKNIERINRQNENAARLGLPDA